MKSGNKNDHESVDKQPKHHQILNNLNFTTINRNYTHNFHTLHRFLSQKREILQEKYVSVTQNLTNQHIKQNIFQLISEILFQEQLLILYKKTLLT
jgi:hypothetical protein